MEPEMLRYKQRPGGADAAGLRILLLTTLWLCLDEGVVA